MRLEDLEVFRAVHETGSFVRAAQRSGLTTSAVTKVVRKLEDEFGLQLVERGARAIALTAAGRMLYDRALQVSELSSAIRSDMAGQAAAVRGTIRVGVVPALLNSVATPVLAKILMPSADVRLMLSVLHSGELMRLIQEARLDLALGFGVQDLPPDIVCTRVARQRYRLVARAGHPLSGRRLSVDQLSPLRWLLPTRDVAVRAAIERMFTDAGLGAPDVQVETDASATLLFQLLRGTDLVAVLAEQAFQPLNTEGLTTLDIELDALVGDVALYHRRQTPTTGLLVALKDQLTLQAQRNFSR